MSGSSASVTPGFEQPPIDDDEIAALSKVVGTFAKESSISQVKFELFGSPNVRAGSRLRVGSGGNNVFYQVFDGRINEEIALTGGERAYVEAAAEPNWTLGSATGWVRRS